MKTLLTLCLAAVGLAGFASTKAEAKEATLAEKPAVVHIDQTVVIETHHRHHYRHYYHHHRHYYWRHHHRYYY